MKTGRKRTIGKLAALILGGMLATTMVSSHSPAATPHGAATVISGEAEGPSVLVYLPATQGATTLGTHELLSNVQLNRGTMTLLNTLPDERGAEVPGNPDWVVLIEDSWVLHDADGDTISHPLVRSNRGELAASLVESAIAPSFDEEQPDWQILPMTNAMALGSDGMLVVSLPVREVPTSRRNHWARNMTLDLLVHLDMLEERPTAASLVPDHELGFALYDAEGVGGAGPYRMERIVNTFPGHVPVMRICREDIHDHVLTAFNGAIFPGGSGRGIAVGIREKGVSLLDEYIRNGGGYMGICAGAYFANSGVDVYLNAVPIVHNQPWRKGRGMLDVELTPAGREILGEEFTQFTTRYANGPVYLEDVNPILWEDDPDLVVLGHFRSTVDDPNGEPSKELLDTPAIVSYLHGQGNMIMISPHPETHEELDPMMQRGLLWMSKRSTALIP
ncbi:MAG: hypothetical protein JJU11_01720 [Candidatus Sumerlaeia bacterium]|nr:hypothetical protein [Candidatus Sumerlaeia bacterium]